MAKKLKKEKDSPKKLPKLSQITIGGVTQLTKLLFVKHMAVMLKSGMALSDILNVLFDQAQGKFKNILKSIKEKISAGHAFYESLADFPKVFSPIFINLIRAGEMSGTLEENLRQIATQMEKDYGLRKKVRAAMLYPVVVLIVVFVVGSGIAVFVLPKITPLFKGLGVNLPWTTKLLISVSDFFQNYGWWPVLIALVVIIFLIWIAKLKFIKPVTHWLILKLPISGKISRNLNAARFTRTLGTLLKSGLTIDEGLGIAGQVLTNFHFKKAIIQSSETIRTGDTLGKILQQWPNLFPKICFRMIEVGEKTGSLDETLLYLAEFFEAEVDDTTKNLSNILEPVLLIIIGLVVAFLALSIITPIYQITGSIR